MTAEVKTDDTKTEPESFDWDELVPAEVAPYKVSSVSSKFDPMDPKDGIPAAIRTRIETALLKYMEDLTAYALAGNKPENFRPKQHAQIVRTEAQGKEFIRLAKKWAKYRPTTFDGRDSRTPEGQITVRLGAPGKYRDEKGTEHEWAVRFTARKLQKSDTARLPGSAK